MAIFCTDAGHGGTDSGTAWGNILEKDINLSYVLALNQLLKARGHQVMTTRKSDHNVADLPTRCQLINQHHRQKTPQFDAIVSIHCNIAIYKDPVKNQYQPQFDVRGFYGIYSQESQQSQELTQCIVKAVSTAKIPLKESGSVSTIDLGRPLAWIHQTLPPAALLQMGFITHPEELAQLQDTSHQRLLITAIADGLEKFTQR